METKNPSNKHMLLSLDYGDTNFLQALGARFNPEVKFNSFHYVDFQDALCESYRHIPRCDLTFGKLKRWKG